MPGLKILIGILAEDFLPRSFGIGRNVQLLQHLGLKQSLGYWLFKELLRGGYIAWRNSTGHQHTDLARGDANWKAMMAATAGEYQHLRNAKSRGRRAQQKLLALAKQWEGVQ